MKSLRSDHPAVVKGRTIFLKTVKPPADVKRLLQPASTNRKLGGGKNEITRGRWRGMPLYQLTLEERKTCPNTCQQWSNCYGNNMPFANRILHTSPSFLGALRGEISHLAGKHSGGFAVRLHVLGDFFSTSYVRFWEKELKKHPELRIYGYTHREKRGKIGLLLDRMNDRDRVWIRFSDAGDVPMAANVGGPGIPCPEQTGKTESCLTCGLCWQTEKPIHFAVH